MARFQRGTLAKRAVERLKKASGRFAELDLIVRLSSTSPQHDDDGQGNTMERPLRGTRYLVSYSLDKYGHGRRRPGLRPGEEELGPQAPEDFDLLVLLLIQAEALFPSFKLRVVL